MGIVINLDVVMAKRKRSGYYHGESVDIKE